MVDPCPNDTDQLSTHVDRLRVRPLIITSVPLLHAAFHLRHIVGRQGKTLETVTSSYGPRRNKVVKRKRVKGPESTPQTLYSLIDRFGHRIHAVGIVASSPRVLDIVPCLEMLEPLRMGIVDVLSIGDELGRRSRSVGSRHFMWRMG